MPVRTLSLEEAMSRYAGGDTAAFADLYDKLAPALYRFLLRLSRNQALAEDLSHETFLRIHKAKELYRPGAPVMPWAYTIAKRLYVDHVRLQHSHDLSLEITRTGERKSDPGIASDEPAADTKLAVARAVEEVELVLQRLPENQAIAFRLIKQEGMSMSEAAAVLGTTETAVKLRAHRAYQALREAIGPHLDLDL